MAHTAAEMMIADFVDSAPETPFVEVQNLPDAIFCYRSVTYVVTLWANSDRLGFQLIWNGHYRCV